MLLNCGVGEDSWESLGLQGDQTSPSFMKSVLNINWKDWCWSWNSNTLATWCEELTHWKRPWCWARLKIGGEGMTEHEMVGWHHWLAGHEFKKAPGVADGQGSLACCSPWGSKELDTTEWLNWTELAIRLSAVEVLGYLVVWQGLYSLIRMFWEKVEWRELEIIFSRNLVLQSPCETDWRQLHCPRRICCCCLFRQKKLLYVSKYRQ